MRRLKTKCSVVFAIVIIFGANFSIASSTHRQKLPALYTYLYIWDWAGTVTFRAALSQHHLLAHSSPWWEHWNFCNSAALRSARRCGLRRNIPTSDSWASGQLVRLWSNFDDDGVRPVPYL